MIFYNVILASVKGDVHNHDKLTITDFFKHVNGIEKLEKNLTYSIM